MASTIPDDFIHSLLSKTDILDVIRTRLPLKKAGANYIAQCPFHQEKTPSFSVNQAKQFYYCFGCGAKGDAIKFVKQYESISFVDAVETIASLAGVEVPKVEYKSNNHTTNNSDNNKKQYLDKLYACLQEAATFFAMQLKKTNPKSKDAIAYLKQRGITGVTAKEFNLGYALDSWDGIINHLHSKYSEKILIDAGLAIPSKKSNRGYFDRFRDRIIFPIKDRRGRVVGFGGRVINKGEPKYLNSPETTVFNKSKELYGLYELSQANGLRDYGDILVVEGYLDVISLSQAGIKNSVATLGTALTEQHVKTLLSLKNEIIFCFDGDKAGQKAAWRAVEICLPLIDGNKLIKFVSFPESLDPDSFLKQHGKDNFYSELSRAKSIYDFIFLNLSSDLDLMHIDGKVGLIAKIKPLLSIIKHNFIKQVILEKLAQVTDVDKNILQQDLTKIDFSGNNPHIDNNNKFYGKNRKKEDIKVFYGARGKAQTQVPLLVRASALLLFNRSLIEFVDCLEGIEDLKVPGVKFFVGLANALRKNPEATEEEIIGLLPYEHVKHFNLKELKSIAYMIPEDGVEAEFCYALKYLRKSELEEDLNKLLEIANSVGLTKEQKLALNEMLVESKSITKDGEFI